MKVNTLRLFFEQMARGDASLSHRALWHSIKPGLFFVSKIELDRGGSPDFLSPPADVPSQCIYQTQCLILAISKPM